MILPLGDDMDKEIFVKLITVKELVGQIEVDLLEEMPAFILEKHLRRMERAMLDLASEVEFRLG
jgi:hypothetical protein